MEPSTFFLERYREVTDASRTPTLQKAKEEAQQLVDRVQHGTELHQYNDDLSWTFQEGPAAGFIGKWFWVRGVSNKPTPDHAIYSADLYELMIRPRDHGPLTNVAASTFLEEEFARHNVTFRVEEPGMLVVHSQAAAPFVAAALAESHRMSSLRKPAPSNAPPDATWLQPFGPLTTKAAKAANLSPAEAKPYALLYTYSLIMALVCGTAGLPHILVRFYTNPDGVAAKRTTMWVMILIGVFYVFPPVFGVIGRNLLPELYAGVGAKGTDKIVLELPRILNERHAPLGSVLSGITCAGAFAAFMSTFSGLLVSMTGALAHDVYGRILRPASTPSDRMRMFKLFAWVVGGAATVLGCFVEPLQINFMVGQAFAIAAASYFPLLFMSVWWRGMTMRGAATGMLSGGVAAVVAVSVTNFSDLGWLNLKPFWVSHPLLRILLEQPAIWAVPGAILLMIVISKLSRREVPADIRMKMLVLHAPEALGLKQEYIREHEGGH
jgi:Na+(H+)/acetate symporter ActP